MMKRKVFAIMVVICIVMILIPTILIGSANGRDTAIAKVTEVPIGKSYTETCEVWETEASIHGINPIRSYRLLADVKSTEAVGLASKARRPNPFDTSPLLVKNVKKLTPYTSDTCDESPSFSPDGTKIIFESCTMAMGNPIFDDNIWIMDIDENNKKRLSKSEYCDGSPSFSPDGTKIIFESVPKISSREVEKNIWIMNIDGSNQKQITIADTQKCPSWSPKGTKKVFYESKGETISEPGSYSSWSASVTTTMTSTRNVCTHPSWSPDGSKIVFENFYTIWMMNCDGSNLTLLSPEGAVDSYPSWSPEGSKIVFISSKSKNTDTWMTDIWTMGSDGSNRKQLMDDDALEWEPSYSPDGKKIVFTSLQSGIPSIWIMDSDGTNKQQLTSGYPAEQPKWSSDGSNIVFASNGDIWMMTLNATPAVTPTPEPTTIVTMPGQLTSTPVTAVPKLTPTTPRATTAPTATKIPTSEEKEVPGFEAVFAIAGLLVVVYLLGTRR